MIMSGEQDKPVIAVKGLTRSFGPITAVDRVSLKVHKGQVYGFIGLNGAGKTTLIRMLLGMIKPGNGSVHLFGQEVSGFFPYWNRVGYLVETPFAYPELTVMENLIVFARLRHLQKSAVDEIIEKLKLSAYTHRRAGTLSLGNRQRLGLAKAMMHKPDLLILDEPINGLDPAGIVEVRQLLRSLAASGSTIFLSSHIISEISRVATRIGMIHEGRLVKELNVIEIQQQLQRSAVVNTHDNERALAVLRNQGIPVELQAEELIVTAGYFLDHPDRLAELLVREKLSPRKLVPVTEDLEHFFLRTIDNPARR